MREASLLKLTGQEREIRKRIEDIGDQNQNQHDGRDNSTIGLSMKNSNLNAEPPDGRAKANGEQPKKGKKRKGQ
jgi:hypothetical protein